MHIKQRIEKIIAERVPVYARGTIAPFVSELIDILEAQQNQINTLTGQVAKLQRGE